MTEEADSGLTPASASGNEFQGDLGLPTPEDTGSETAGSPTEADPAAAEDSSTGTPPDEAGAPQEAAAEAAVSAEVYRALGRDWESEEAFAQHYKSLEGRVRAQGQEAARLNNTIDQWENWHAHTEAQAKAAPAPELVEGKPKAKAEPFIDAIDWSAVKRLNDEKGFEHAMQAVVLGLQDHQDTVVKELKDQIAEATAPLRETAAVAQADTEAKQWFYNAANTVDPESGAPLFPDLFDQGENFNEGTATQIVNAWGKLVRTHPQFGLTRDGIDYAIELGKKVATEKVAPAKAAAKVAGKVARDASGQFVKKSEAAAKEEAAGGVDTPDVVGEASTVSEAEQARRDIKNAGRASDKASFFGIA